MVESLARAVSEEIVAAYPGAAFQDKGQPHRVMADAYAHTGRRFVVVIDEWDCVHRSDDVTGKAADYVKFLRLLLKDKKHLALAFMTGILPIKKYRGGSSLNMFDEFTMLDPAPLAPYVGFTSGEVHALCGRWGMGYDELADWYNGYQLEGAGEVFCPNSVVSALRRRKCAAYWKQTGAFEDLGALIGMNFDGLPDAIVEFLAGGRRPVDAGGYANDMSSFRTLDDVLTLLIHMGYLAYDPKAGMAFVPNKEVACEFEVAVRGAGWPVVSRALAESNALLNATWALDAAKVAAGVGAAHLDTSHLQYNDENALSYTVSTAYYSAREHYAVVRELPAGKGFADLAFVPLRAHAGKPPMLVELKWDRSASGAIAQIKERGYCDAFKGLAGHALLVGIAYSKKTRKHTCAIERFELAPG